MYNATAVCPVKELQIPQQMSRLNALEQNLKDTICKLAERTKSIRLDRPVNPSKATNELEVAKVPLACELSSLASRIEQAIMALDEITNTLEV